MTQLNSMETDFSEISNYKSLGSLIIVSGASGTGKSTICKAVIAANQNLKFSISCTTRKPREGEINGKDYSFIDMDKFNKLIKADKFMEYANVHGNYYGTLKEEVINRVKEGKDVLLDIDVQGAMAIKKNFKNDSLISKCMELIFILPPSLSELEKRLKNRNTDSEEVIQKRLNVAKKEIDHFLSYDYFIINDDLNKAISDIQTIINSFKCKTNRLSL